MTKPTSPAFMTRPLRRIAAGILFGAAAILAACAQRAPAPVAGEEPLVISQSTNASLQEYLAKIYPNLRGAFAITPDGANSFYFYCPDIGCSVSLYGGIALSQCRSLTAQDCILFYVADEPRRAYTVATEKSPIGHHGYRRAMPLDEMFFNQ